MSERKYYEAESRLKDIRRMHDRMNSGMVDEITWNDLEMDEVFLEVNHTKSFIGEQLLYHSLHCGQNEFADDVVVEISQNKIGILVG